MNEMEVKFKIRTLLGTRLHRLGLDDSELKDSENLIQSGILDSLTLIEFVSEIEEEFNLEIDFEEIDITEFTSVDKIAVILVRLKGEF